MNTTISRLAASAPVAVALLGFSLGSAHAAPYEPGASEKVQIQPAGDPPEWDVDLPLSDDLPDGDPPVDPPDDVGPADPADEPEDEPEDDGSDDESDEDAGDESNASDNGGSSSNGGSSTGGGSKSAKDADKGGSDVAEPAPVEAADVQFTPASARGVQVPAEAVAAAGAALVGIFGWATYRRMKATATV